MKTDVYDRWNNRARWAKRNIEGYDETKNTVDCKNHGKDQSFSQIADSTGWARICNQCVNEFFREIEDAVEGDEIVDVCFHDECMNDAIPSNHCALCQEIFCGVHMVDDICCQKCTEKAEAEFGPPE
jgi:hypothetical protein